jgi:hypothetical protein
VLAVATDAGTFTRAAAYPIVTTMTFMMQTNDNSYVRSVNGVVVPPPAFKDYFLFERDYRCSFRPIFSFAVNGTWHTVLADIGRRMTPPVAYPPFARVCPAYDACNPQDAMLTPDFAAFLKMTFLQRFDATEPARAKVLQP